MGLAVCDSASSWCLEWRGKSRMGRALFRSCFLGFALVSTSIAAQQPQRTTASYDDWLVECSLLPRADQRTPASNSTTNSAPAKPDNNVNAANERAEPATTPAARRSCEMVQTFVVRETGGTLAKLAIGKQPGADQVKAILISPLGVYLADGASIKLDSTNEIRGNYTRCETHGCFAEFPLSAEKLASLRAATTATLTFINAQRMPITFQVSLKGFAPAYDAVTSQSP